MSRCCTGFALARRQAEAAARAASAGNGLPAIEPGMPDPAGTGLDRRSFLLRGSGLALSVYGASKLGLGVFEEGIASAAETPGQTVLVSIFMPGGLDGLSVLAPVNDAVYTAKRPGLKLTPNPDHTFADDPRLQWHPSALALKALHEAGKVTVFPSIGYDHPNQSHFTSRHYWEVGAVDPHGNSGWLGRFLDVAGSEDNPLQGLSLSNYLAPSLAAASVPTASVSSPTGFDFWTDGVGSQIRDDLYDSFGRLGLPATDDFDLGQARRAVRHTDGVRRSMATLIGREISSAGYPPGGNVFPSRLAVLAEMLSMGMPMRCVALEGVGSYDTHSGQVAALDRDLKLTIDSVAAFQADIEARGLADRVLVQIWSEFGRRVEENGGGTDHGAAGVAFLIGSRARRAMVGEWAGLATLDPQGNMRNTSDFRVMYAALVDQWLGADPAAVIAGADQMTLPSLVAA